MFKMQNIDPADVPEASVEIHQAKLAALSTYFRDIYSKDFRMNIEYIDLYQWAKHFCVVVKAAHKEKELKDSITEGQ